MIDEDVSRVATRQQTPGEHREQQHGEGGGEAAVSPCPGRQRGGRGSPCAN